MKKRKNFHNMEKLSSEKMIIENIQKEHSFRIYTYRALYKDKVPRNFLRT
jgi:hypothetical protein